MRVATPWSRYVLIGGRFPGRSIQLSRDSGLSWEFYQIGTGTWVNGGMLEIEPDVVLFVYGGPQSPKQLRYDISRITRAMVWSPVKACGLSRWVMNWNEDDDRLADQTRAREGDIAHGASFIGTAHLFGLK